MVATWRDSWFEEGTRVFYIAPRPYVEQVLPITIAPAPESLARVFVGRMEVITPDRLKQVERALMTRDMVPLMRLGRFLPSISDRLQATMSEAEKAPLRAGLAAVAAAKAAAALAGPRCQ